MEAIGRDAQYEVFADGYREHAEDGFYNACIDRPACLGLLGDVRGLRVLDAACGPGLYAEELVGRGADVVGFDVSERMVALSAERVPTGDFRVHDLNDPLSALADASFDRVLCALAIEHVDDRIGALAEFRRVLRPGGALVLSRLHPTGDWLRNGGDYFAPRVVEEVWRKGWVVRHWATPLELTCEELYRAGFLLERIVEPRPVPSAAAHADHEKLSTGPHGFLAIRAVPRPAPLS